MSQDPDRRHKEPEDHDEKSEPFNERSNDSGGGGRAVSGPIDSDDDE